LTEFFLLSPSESPFHVELLAMVANLHADPRYRCEVDGCLIRFLWLVPITSGEADLARSKGVEALERLLEQSGVNPVAAMRRSVA
jgi:hypothetical protein